MSVIDLSKSEHDSSMRKKLAELKALREKNDATEKKDDKKGSKDDGSSSASTKGSTFSIYK